MKNNQSKVVLITGGAKGIGSALTTLFAQKGYSVLLNYYQSHSDAKHLEESLNQKGYKVVAYQADIRSREAVNKMLTFCQENLGDVSVLINNAGISQSKLFTEISDEEWQSMVATHLNGAFYCTQAVLKPMISKQYGSVINISSIWGMVGASCEVHYSTVKAGLIGMTKALAKEVGPSHIRVNCIAPGIIDTAMLSDLTRDEIDQLIEQVPLGRLGTPLEVAKLALFLAEDDAAYLTGQVISPNGGFVI